MYNISCEKFTGDSMNINKNYLNLEDSYLFSTIAKKVNYFIKENPDKDIIRLGIGDVTLPLAPVIVEAIKKAAEAAFSVCLSEFIRQQFLHCYQLQYSHVLPDAHYTELFHK